MVDQAGNIYTSAKKGVVVFSPDGKVIHSYLGKDYSNLHDMEIRVEGENEFIYGARNNDAEGIKFDVKTGEIVMRLPFPKASGLGFETIQPQRQLPWHPMGIFSFPMAMQVIISSSLTRLENT